MTMEVKSNGAPAVSRRQLATSVFAGSAMLTLLTTHLANSFVTTGKNNYVANANLRAGRQRIQGDNFFTTAAANFFCWFVPHNGKYPLPESLISSINSKLRPVIFVAETVFINQAFEATTLNGSDITKCLTSLLFDNNFLDTNGGNYIHKNKIPILIADLLVPPAAKKVLYKGDKNTTRVILDFLLPAAISAPLSTSLVLRRKFLAAGAATIAGMTAGAVLPYQQLHSEKSNKIVVIKLRNALIALKILHAAKHIREQKQVKPTFIVAMGSAHIDIAENLKRGIDYNAKLVSEILGNDEDLAGNLGNHFRKAILYDPARTTIEEGLMEISI